MKIFISAIALVIAAPAAAQTAPAADPHAGHGQQQGQHSPGHDQHKQSGDKSKPMDCKCCDKSKQQSQKMECCAKHGEGHAAPKAPRA